MLAGSRRCAGLAGRRRRFAGLAGSRWPYDLTGAKDKRLALFFCRRLVCVHGCLPSATFGIELWHWRPSPPLFPRRLHGAATVGQGMAGWEPLAGSRTEATMLNAGSSLCCDSGKLSLPYLCLISAFSALSLPYFSFLSPTSAYLSPGLR